MPAYKNKMWDGKIRLYNIVTGEIYMGLLPYIEEYLQNNGVIMNWKKESEVKEKLPQVWCKGLYEVLDPLSMDAELKYEIIRLMPLPTLLPQIVLCLFLLLLPVNR